MNLRKIYPYISKRLNDVLMRFSVGAKKYYATVYELIQDLYEAVPKVLDDSSAQTGLTPVRYSLVRLRQDYQPN